MKNQDSENVTRHIRQLEPNVQPIVEHIRQTILNIDVEIAERIKWNSPSFHYTGPMKEFDAKEYKQDIAVLNVHRGKILIVLPTGNIIDDDILKGKNYPDGRKIIEIQDLEDAKNKTLALTSGIRNWLDRVEK